MHDISLITTIAFGFTAALIFGLGAKYCGLSPIVGYLVAGMIIGPHTPGFVGDVHLASQLAEIGVILLMFGVGLHFHFDELLAVRSIAVPGALGQSIVATLCGLAVALWAGWSVSAGTVLGIAVSVASTVVLLRVLMDHQLVESVEGRAAVGWLVVEDILTVIVLVALPALAAGPSAEGRSVVTTLALALGKLALLAVLVAYAGTRYVPRLLLRVARLRSTELFTLTVLVIAMGVATLGFVAFGASMALGAFMAGMVVGQSKVSHQAAANALPMRDAFAVLFFVSVGMLFDYRAILHDPWLTAGLLAVILIAKPLAALLIVLVTGHTLRVGLTVAGGLAQIGEFSFILSELARELKVLPEAAHHALVGAAIISISLNPFYFKALLALEPWLQKRPRLLAFLTRRSTARGRAANTTEAEAIRAASDHVLAIVVGYGPVGRTVARRIQEFGLVPVVIDMNVDTVLALQAEGKRALYGDATRAEILREAGLGRATYLIVTIPELVIGTAVVLAARELNPQVRILARTRHLVENDAFEQAGVFAVLSDEAEAANAVAVVLQADLKGQGFARK